MTIRSRRLLPFSALALLVAAGCSSAAESSTGITADEISTEQARAYAQVPYRGVNLSGAEFGQQHLQDAKYGTDYTYPTCDEVEFFVHHGMNTFRLPTRWERLQKTIGGPLDATEMARLRAFVDMATGRGAHVILEIHNFGAYGWASTDPTSQPESDVIGSQAVPTSALADFWGKVAAQVQGFAHPDHVIFGLMNEPERIATTTWFDAAEQAVAAIRKAGAKSLILVPGVRWTGAHDWSQTPDDPGGFMPGASSADGATAMLKTLRAKVADYEPIAFEVHEYVDANFSGTIDGDCTNASTAYFEDFRKWLEANHEKGFVGEFGVPRSCAHVAADFAAYFEKNAADFEGWTYWAAGPWWGGYFLSLEPGAPESEAVLGALGPHLEAYPGAVPNTCGGAPPSPTPTPAPTPQPPAPPPPTPGPGRGSLAATLAISSDWGSGYCVDAHVENRGNAAVDGWSATIDVGSSTITQAWGATSSAASGRVTFVPVDYDRTIAAGGSGNFGFCANRGTGAGAPVVVSVK